MSPSMPTKAAALEVSGEERPMKYNYHSVSKVFAEQCRF
jgi:hypothetical protein